jgi:hypothetical protein
MYTSSVLATSKEPIRIHAAVIPHDTFLSPDMHQAEVDHECSFPLRHKTTPRGGRQLSVDELLSSATKSDLVTIVSVPTRTAFDGVDKVQISPCEIALVTPPVAAASVSKTIALPLDILPVTELSKHLYSTTTTTSSDLMSVSTSSSESTPRRVSGSAVQAEVHTPPTHLLMEYGRRGRFKANESADITSMLHSPPRTDDTTDKKKQIHREKENYVGVDESMSSAYSLCSEGSGAGMRTELPMHGSRTSDSCSDIDEGVGPDQEEAQEEGGVDGDRSASYYQEEEEHDDASAGPFGGAHIFRYEMNQSEEFNRE